MYSRKHKNTKEIVTNSITNFITITQSQLQIIHMC